MFPGTDGHYSSPSCITTHLQEPQDAAALDRQWQSGVLRAEAWREWDREHLLSQGLHGSSGTLLSFGAAMGGSQGSPSDLLPSRATDVRQGLGWQAVFDPKD